jgi:hypothetical protein
MTALLAAAVIAALAFALRIGVHAGRTPGGVDTWYYLAYADAFRRRPSLDVRLPQYLLQDERQSYPPVFPSLLALLPRAWRRRGYWLIAPAIDCLHLLLLFFVAHRLTASVPVAALAAGTYAVTPQLVSETRSLSARPLGALLHSGAMLLLLKYTVSSGEAPWALAAVAAGSALYLASAAMAAAYSFLAGAMALLFHDVRYALVPLAGLALATLLSGGYMFRVVRNYVFAVEYWRRNHHAYGRHPVRDSPVLAPPEHAAPSFHQPGFLGGSALRQLLRLLGENPFLLALPFVPPLTTVWERHLYFWAVALAGLSVLATILPPLRAFGPGRSYMKAAIFPTAYVLAAGIGTPAGLLRPPGLVVLAGLVASAAAIAFFYAYVRNRPTEQTASVPPGLRAAVQALAAMPRGGVFVLPYMYADYVGYWSGQPVLWGGHCGDHRRFEQIAPVITRPLDELFRERGVRYLLVDERYVTVEELRLGGVVAASESADGFVLFDSGAPQLAFGGSSGSPKRSAMR